MVGCNNIWAIWRCGYSGMLVLGVRCEFKPHQRLLLFLWAWNLPSLPSTGWFQEQIQSSINLCLLLHCSFLPSDASIQFDLWLTSEYTLSSQGIDYCHPIPVCPLCSHVLLARRIAILSPVNIKQIWILQSNFDLFFN